MVHFSVLLLDKHISIKYYIVRGQKAQIPIKTKQREMDDNP